MMPVIAWNTIHMSTILRESMSVLRSRCVEGIEANVGRSRELLDRSTAMATALTPYLGYAKTAEIAKEAVQDRPVDLRDRPGAGVDGSRAALAYPVRRKHDASWYRGREGTMKATVVCLLAGLLGVGAVQARRAGAGSRTAWRALPSAGSRAPRRTRPGGVAEAGSDHGCPRHRGRRVCRRHRRRRGLVHDPTCSPRRTERPGDLAGRAAADARGGAPPGDP